jgi:hypothetical protein
MLKFPCRPRGNTRPQAHRMTDHPNKHIRAAIEYALRRGWRLRKAGGQSHIWGTLYCPLQSREGCQRHVYSTPRNAEITRG